MNRTISISHNNTLLQQQNFTSEYEKNKIIEKWKKIYGKNFKQAVIDVEPKPIKEAVIDVEHKREKSNFKKGYKAKTYRFNKPNSKIPESRL